MKMKQAVSPHNPDKSSARTVRFEQANRINRIGQVSVQFDIANIHPALSTHKDLNRGRACLKISRACFERVSARHDPPDLIQTETFQRCLGDVQMTLMRRVKTTTEQANPRTRATWRKVLSRALARHIKASSGPCRARHI